MEPREVVLASCVVDSVRQRVRRPDGAPEVALTSREVDLLRYLVAHPSRVIPRDELLTEVWGYSDSVLSRASDNTVRRLREKIERDPARPDHVLTVHGAGYRFEPVAGPGQEVAAPARPARSWVALGPAAEVAVDLPSRQMRRGADPPAPFTEAEALLLEVLVGADGAVVPPEALRRAVWGHGRNTSQRLAGLVSRLRRKLEVDPGRPTVLLTAHGGYRVVHAQALAALPDGDALVGREASLAELAAATGRWVVLVGPAGIGKSTLARAAAAGALWVDLASVRDPAAAAAAVAGALGVDVLGADPAVRVRDVLARRAGWVVLDNLEQVPGMGELVDRWLSLPGRARLLGTSRVRVGAASEIVVELGPLADEAAVDLFVRRASSAAPGARYGPDERRTVAALVRRLDGNPLAIELAAARTATMGLADLERRLSVALLSRPAGGDPRHQRVRALIDDTLSALPPALGAALEGLSLFRAGFGLDDAEALVGPDAVDLVAELRDRSLLRRVEDVRGEARYSGWELVREMLEERGVAPELIRRFGDRLARFGRAPLVDRLGWDDTETETAWLWAQLDDVVRAARQLLRVGEAELAACTAAAALWVLGSRGPFAEALALGAEVLATAPPGQARALVQRALGEVANSRGDFVGAERHFRAGIDDLDGFDEPFLVGSLWCSVGSIVGRLNRRDEARRAYAVGLPILRAGSLDAGWVAFREAGLADVVGDEPAREAAIRRVAVAAREAGNAPLHLRARMFLGLAARNDGRLREAIHHLVAVRELAEARGEPARAAAAVRHLLNTVCEQGDVEATDRWAAVAVQLADELGAPFERSYALFCQATAAAGAADRPRAHRLLDEVEATSTTAAHHGELANEVAALRAYLALCEGATADALVVLRRVADEAGDDPAGQALCGGALAMAHLAAGDPAGARRTLDATPLTPYRVAVIHRLCQEAVIRAAEGRPSDELLVEARAEAVRSDRALGEGDEALVGGIVGPWAVRWVRRA